MSRAKPPIPPSTEKAWQSLLTSGRRVDPNDTISIWDAQAIAQAADTRPTMQRPQAPITPSELPQLPVTASPPEASGAVVTGADFEVTGILGEGGMGRVLLARQRSLQRDVALKVLKDSTAREYVDALLSEAVITGSIEHPCIVPIHALGRDAEGRPVLVMKRIEGVSWKRLARESDHPMWASLAPDDGDRLDAHMDIFMSVCNAAHFAHDRGIVHRDIKLDNVMIGAFGEVYLVDWGIAMRVGPSSDMAMEDGGPPIGTLSYMAPEMAFGRTSLIDARTDVYLLGATLHSLLTGKPRHVGDSILDVLTSAGASEPFEYDPSVPSELASICNRAMHHDREMRFSSALELKQAIALFKRHRGSVALSDKAAAQLDGMDDAPPLSTSLGPAGATRRAYQRLTECRFGFMQALAAWKGNAAARQGLDRCLERMFEHEITQRDAEGARALLSELSSPRPDLEVRLGELTRELERAQKAEARLRQIERDADLHIGMRIQLIGLGVLLACATATFSAIYLTAGNHPTPQRLVVFAAVLLGVIAILYVAVRGTVRTAITRRAFGMLVVLPAAIVTHRIIAMAYAATSEHILSADLGILAALAASMAIAIHRHLAWAAATFFLGAVAATVFPATAPHVFTLATSLAIVLILVLWTHIAKSVRRELRAASSGVMPFDP